MRNLFRLKSNKLHPACAIYEGVSTCKEKYIGETKRNVEIPRIEHSGINKISEPSRHLKSHSAIGRVLVLVKSHFNDCIN